jgi:hypothetical protein
VDDDVRETMNEISREHDRMFKEMTGLDRSMYYDRQGKAIGMGDWAALRNEDEDPDLDYIVVARTRFDSDLEVSTVWLGIDHNFMMHGPPIIFETMIFRHLPEPVTIETELFGSYTKERESVSLGDLDDADPWDFQQRYATEEQARTGHRAVCEELERRGHVPVSAGTKSPTGDS